MSDSTAPTPQDPPTNTGLAQSTAKSPTHPPALEDDQNLFNEAVQLDAINEEENIEIKDGLLSVPPRTGEESLSQPPEENIPPRKDRIESHEATLASPKLPEPHQHPSEYLNDQDAPGIESIASSSKHLDEPESNRKPEYPDEVFANTLDPSSLSKDTGLPTSQFHNFKARPSIVNRYPVSSHTPLSPRLVNRSSSFPIKGQEPDVATWKGVGNKVRALNSSEANSVIKADRIVKGKEADATIRDNKDETNANGSNEPGTSKQPKDMPSTSEVEEPITLKDAVGRKFTFPWALCKTWKGMETLVNQAFLHVDTIGEHVVAGFYDLVGPGGDIILPQVWEHLVKPGWHVSMHMWPMPELPKKNEASMGHTAPGSLPPPPPPPPPGPGMMSLPLPGMMPPPPPPPPGFNSSLAGPPRDKRKMKKGAGGRSVMLQSHGGPPPPLMPRPGMAPPPTKLHFPDGLPLPPKMPSTSIVPLYGTHYADMVKHMSQNHMPHLQAVLGKTCRHKRIGKIFCYDTLLTGGAHADIGSFDCSHDDCRRWKQTHFSEAIARFRPSRTTNIRRRTIIVEDLSPMLIEALGSAFKMNPEFFEEHLNRSGYRSDSYDNPHPHLWNTNAVPKDYISIKWFRPVYRDRQKPISDAERVRLISSTTENENGIELSWKIDSELTTARSSLYLESNIFRREWPLTANLTDASSRGEGKYPASWEERATLCSVDVEGCSVVIILLDPLPAFRSADDSRLYNPQVPFEQAYSRSPIGAGLGMVGLFSGRDLHTKMDRLSSYLHGTQSTAVDLTRWIKEPEPELFDFSDSNLEPNTALLWIIHRDVIGFLTMASDALLEIGLSSTNDFLMQQQLSHWRDLMTKFQVELPELRAAIENLARFNTELTTTATPPFIAETIAQIDILIEQNEKSYSALRADMALLESKKSIAQAESVGKLTELGFIFVPISCVASLFSMNVTQLSNPVPLTSFIWGAVIALALAYLVRLWMRSSTLPSLTKNHSRAIRDYYGLSTYTSIPTSTVISYMTPKFLSNLSPVPNTWKPGSRFISTLLGILLLGALMVPISIVWTHHHIDSGFKGMMTVIVFIFVATMALAYAGLSYKAEIKRRIVRPYV